MSISNTTKLTKATRDPWKAYAYVKSIIKNFWYKIKTKGIR